MALTLDDLFTENTPSQLFLQTFFNRRQGSKLTENMLLQSLRAIESFTKDYGRKSA